MTDITKEETTPDQLMDSFRGHSLKSIVLFTIIIHVVVIGVTSVPYFLKSAGGDLSKGGEQERMDEAAREATSALRDIAEKYGVKPDELSERFSSGSPAKTPVSEAPKTETPEEAPAQEPAEPESALEKEINIKQDGPKLPGIGSETEDLFK